MPRRPGPAGFPPRPAKLSWPATGRADVEVLERLTSTPFVLADARRQHLRVVGIELLVGWLGDQSGSTWQERWASSGADIAGAGWRQMPAAWLAKHGRPSRWAQDLVAGALVVAISADMVRPSLSWLLAGHATNGCLVANLAASRDPDGFARLRAHCDAAGVPVAARSRTLSRCALIMAAKGATLADITVGRAPRSGNQCPRDRTGRCRPVLPNPSRDGNLRC